MKSLDASGPEDENGIKKASVLIHSMIDAEVEAGIPSNRIIIGGFSQGGALALYSALTYTKPLAGVVALSSWLPLNKTFPSVSDCLYYAYYYKTTAWKFCLFFIYCVFNFYVLQYVLGNRETPVLQCHGDCDPIVPFKWGQMTASLLKNYLKSIEFKTYTGLMHSSSDEVSGPNYVFLNEFPFFSILNPYLFCYFLLLQEMSDIKDFVTKQLPSV